MKLFAAAEAETTAGMDFLFFAPRADDVDVGVVSTSASEAKEEEESATTCVVEVRVGFACVREGIVREKERWEMWECVCGGCA